MTKSQAIAGAKELQEKLGASWQIKVWENLGWHYSCFRNNITVYPGYNGKKVYHTLISDNEGGDRSGSILWSSHNHNKDPRESVKIAVAAVNKVMEELFAAQHAANLAADF